MKTQNNYRRTLKNFNLLFALVTGLTTVQPLFAITRGPHSVGTLSNATLSGSSASWTNLNNAQTSNDVYCGIPVNGLTSTDQYTDFLLATNFGIDVPAGSTIDGILVEIERGDLYNSNNAKDYEIKIIKNGVRGAENKAKTAAWSSEDYIVYGSATDRWSETWTATDVNSADFGLAISIKKQGGGSNPQPLIDHIRISVYFSATLPINLLFFSGIQNNNIVALKWATSSEINNDYFTVERSNDAVNWIPLGEVDGGGNSSTVKNYFFNDITPVAGKDANYYRLMQFDFDGKSETFKIIAVDWEKPVPSEMTLSPNPSKGKISVGFNGGDVKISSVKIFNIAGEHFPQPGLDPASPDISELPSGIYFVQVNSESGTFTKRIIKRD